MITFACQPCGMKFRVRDEFAGRSTRCPTCKQPLVVPGLESLATEAPSRIPGPASSLARAGMNGEGVTLTHAASADGKRGSVGEALTRQKARDERYVVVEEVARGGMGAVLRAVDGDLRREVAVKYLLDQADARKKLRFVEEAQITGQLEHPNIVPIHELGIDAQGRLFFAMKVVRGRSLKEALDAARDSAAPSLSQFLTIFGSICNALAYAHARGVVHRDLKPANVMLGDFGEVYVMDWGLAKVVTERPAPEPIITLPGRAEAAPPAAASPSGSRSSSRVSTSRGEESDSDLTQDGSVLGTPVYMPPEQAAGRIQQIDQRSDIYSLGAILYEILTLEPPVSREGGNLAVLMRVAQGEIIPPERRAPGRAQKGLIPRELTAVAMKALARDPEDRYQTVQSLQKDIQLFQEGRSVSAKQDTLWEMFQKLVNRNKGVSIATAAALVVLFVVGGYSVKVNYDARVQAEQNYAAFQKEQNEKEKRTREAVPALIQAARLNVERRAPEQASAQVDLALDYAPTNGEARLLRAQLLVARKQFAAGVRELNEYLKQRPDDAEAKTLRELCLSENPDDTSNVLKITATFVRQKVPGLAETALSEFGPNLPEARKQLLELYRARLEKGWPGLGSRLTMDNSGLFRLVTRLADQIADLEALKSIPLNAIEFPGSTARTTNFSVSDLSPLQGMPLTSLKIGCGTQVRDLTPLQGMPLQTFYLGYADSLTDLSPLQGMPLVSLQLHSCKGISDLSPLKGMPLSTLDLPGSSLVLDLTPLRGMKLTSVSLNRTVLGNRKNVNVLREMTTLKTLWFSGLGAYSAEDFWKRYDAGEFRK